MQTLLRKLLSVLKSLHETRQEKFVRSRLKELEKLEFFHSIYFGADAHVCPGWKSSDSMFHSDAHNAVVITRKGKVSGVVAFEIVGSTILFRQLQGAPRGNFYDGTPVEEYLLECAEEVARALKMKIFRVVDAKTAIEYRMSAPEADRPSTEAEKHMERIYNYPAKVGYATRWFWRVRRSTHFSVLS